MVFTATGVLFKKDMLLNAIAFSRTCDEVLIIVRVNGGN